MTARNLPALPPGVVWAAWFQDQRGHRRSAGTFLAATDGGASVMLTVAASSADYSMLVVTRTDDAPDAPWTLGGTLQP